jgi:hypothetical protein
MNDINPINQLETEILIFEMPMREVHKFQVKSYKLIKLQIHYCFSYRYLDLLNACLINS